MRKLALIAFASPALADDVTMDEVQASLAAMGYEIRKAEMEDGKIEVYFVRDGQMGKAHVDPTTGAVVKLEIKS